MKIFFRQVPYVKEICVTVESQVKDTDVKHLLRYLNDYEQHVNVLILEKEGQIYKIPWLEILWIEVVGDYTSIYTNTLTLSIRKTLQSIEAEISSNHFVRASRNTLVNLNQIKKVESSFSGTMSATLLNNQKIHISRQYWKNIKQRILNND